MGGVAGDEDGEEGGWAGGECGGGGGGRGGGGGGEGGGEGEGGEGGVERAGRGGGVELVDAVDDGGVLPYVVREGGLWCFFPFLSRVMHTADLFQFTGLVVAFTGLGLVYLLPRAIPSMRNAIGMPGV